MAINTLHKVTLTEGQIGVILCSLEKSVKYADSDYISEVDGIFEILEGSVDRHYDKIEKAKSKHPVAEWQDTYISVTHFVDFTLLSPII